MSEVLARIGGLAPGERRLLLDGLREETVAALAGDWPEWAHPGQLPTGDDWRTWVLLAGRGFGKTRAGAEWVSAFARACPEARIALVAASPEEARAVMIEGQSGLLAVADPAERMGMLWEPSRRRLVFAGGAQAFVYSAANPESLRGPEHHLAWCDELAKWPRCGAAWDNLALGLRLGARPRALVTTTPRSGPVLRRILGEAGTVLTGGATRANPHLPAAFLEAVEAAHAGTRWGRQELDGVLLDEVEGALWPRTLIESCRAPAPDPSSLLRVVIGVDPPAGTEGDACGIVACGLDAQGIAWVLADHSAAGLSPEGWARKAGAAAESWGAARIVAEANNGGKMVEAVLRGAGVTAAVKLVHASEGKVARAAPVAALFERGAARLGGCFPALEDEMAGLGWGGAWQGPVRSPDRADAMVWAMTELAVKPVQAPPRVRAL